TFLVFFFFFQAEDGIRDRTVTGVQTCALPIFANRTDAPVDYTVGGKAFTVKPGFTLTHQRCRPPEVAFQVGGGAETASPQKGKEIGRASCRERVEIEEADRPVKKKLNYDISAN